MAVVEYWELEDPIQLDEIPIELRRTTQDGPFNSTGRINQGYLYGLDEDFSSKIKNMFSERWPNDSPWAQKEQVKTWCIYVPAKGHENFRIGLDNNIWGFKNKFDSLNKGDKVYFAHGIHSNLTPVPPGFPKFIKNAEDFSGRLDSLVEAIITNDMFYDENEVWPDNIYPDRFNFKTTNELSNIDFSLNSYDKKFIDAARRSANSGKPERIEMNVITPEEFKKLDKYSLEDAMEGLFIDRDNFEEILTLWMPKKNIILQGPPGTGKSFIAKRLAYALLGEEATDRVKMIQFHQTYSYEDFMQGHRPADGGFKLKDGVFYRFVDEALKDPSSKYVFIIDEINRGNLSKIFGETMLLIESDKRGSEWSVDLTYSEEGDKAFYIPENVYLLGMMNTADRSLAMVDYALRRRFAFIDMEPKVNTDKFRQYLINEKGIGEGIVNKIQARIKDLNDTIAEDKVDLGKGFAIGHSYFCMDDPKGNYDNDWYERIIKSEIVPLVREYCFDFICILRTKMKIR